MSIAEFTVTVRSRLALVGRAALRRPLLTGQALFWRAVGKRVRSQHRLARALVPPGLNAYDTWVRHFDTLSEADRARIADEVAQWRDAPLISVVMPVYNPGVTVLEEALRSVRGQLYPALGIVHRRRRLDRSGGAAPARPGGVRGSPHPGRARPENGHIAAATNTALGWRGAPMSPSWTTTTAAGPCALRGGQGDPARAGPRPDLQRRGQDRRRGRRFEPHFKGGNPSSSTARTTSTT